MTLGEEKLAAVAGQWVDTDFKERNDALVGVHGFERDSIREFWVEQCCWC